MFKVNNGLVSSYVADLFPPVVSELWGTPLEITTASLHHFHELMFHKDHVYNQPLECGRILMKVLKTNQRYRPLSILYKLLPFRIYQYYMLEIETTIVTIWKNIYFSINFDVIGAMNKRMVNTASFSATITETRGVYFSK